MPYIYSSLTNDNTFCVYDDHPRINTPKAHVTIKGKANVQDKNTFQTPRGVATQVSDDELALLKTVGEFNRMVKEGYLVIDEKAAHGYDADEKGADMEKDKSAQDNEQTYKDMNKKAPKEEKAKK